MKKLKIKTSISLFSFLFSFCLFLTDRFLKYYAVVNNSTDGFFVLEKNTGIAFSLPLPLFILPILTIIIILFVISFSLKYLQSQKFTLHFATLLIIAGAFSNLIDRFKFGYVIDYLNLKFWPVFNLADVMLVVGVIAWLWSLSKKTKNKSDNNLSSKETRN